MKRKIIGVPIAAANVLRIFKERIGGALPWITALTRIMLVTGAGIRNTAAIPGVSSSKVPKTLASSGYEIQTQRTRHENLEIDELWTYKSHKKNKMWRFMPVITLQARLSLMSGGSVTHDRSSLTRAAVRAWYYL